MRVSSATFLLCFVTIFGISECQNYIAAQILIPTFNGSYYPPNSYPGHHNNSQQLINNNRPPYNNSYNGYPNSYPGQYNNSQQLFNNNRPPYNYSYDNNQPSYNNSYNGYQRPNNSYLYPRNNGSRDGHLFLGNIGSNDRLLFSQEYTKSSRWWSPREKIVNYPQDQSTGYARHEIITAIRLTNKCHDGHNTKTKIEKGGIGRTFVSIRVTSGRANPLCFMLQIFGH